MDIFNRLSDDKQRILVGNAAVERLDSSVNILDDEFNAVGAGGASRPPSSCRLLPQHRWQAGCNPHQSVSPGHGNLAVNQSVINSRKLNHRYHLRT